MVIVVDQSTIGISTHSVRLRFMVVPFLDRGLLWGGTATAKGVEKVCYR